MLHAVNKLVYSINKVFLKPEMKWKDYFAIISFFSLAAPSREWLLFFAIQGSAERSHNCYSQLLFQGDRVICNCYHSSI